VDSEKRKVQSIGALVNQLFARRGYGQVAARDELTSVITDAVGSDLADRILVGKLNRGVLRIFAADSVTLQELTFQKQKILRRLQREIPDCRVSDLRFRTHADTKR